MPIWKRIHHGMHLGVPSQFFTDDSGHLVSMPAQFFDAFLSMEQLNVDLVQSAAVAGEIEVHRDGKLDAVVPHSLLLWLIEQREQG